MRSRSRAGRSSEKPGQEDGPDRAAAKAEDEHRECGRGGRAPMLIGLIERKHPTERPSAGFRIDWHASQFARAKPIGRTLRSRCMNLLPMWLGLHDDHPLENSLVKLGRSLWGAINAQAQKKSTYSIISSH